MERDVELIARKVKIINWQFPGTHILLQNCPLIIPKSKVCSPPNFDVFFHLIFSGWMQMQRR